MINLCRCEKVKTSVSLRWASLDCGSYSHRSDLGDSFDKVSKSEH